MARPIEIVDRGRGPQLSSKRITVQDLVPYLKQNWSPAQILEIMPALTVEEIQAVEDYVRQNREAVMEQDRRIQQRAQERREPREVEEGLRKARRQRLEHARQAIRALQERNGDQAAG